MVLKGGVLEKKRRRRSRNMEFFFVFLERRIKRAEGICGRKPQILF
jgi:hypothetical protein